MKHYLPKLNRQKVGLLLLSGLVVLFTGFFSVQAYANTMNDPDTAHNSTDPHDPDPAHHRTDPTFNDGDPAHYPQASTTAVPSSSAMPSTSASPRMMPSTSPSDMNIGMGAMTNSSGFTDGWFKGRTVTFFYHNRDFFCKNPPMSGATSHCEAGADAQLMPPQNLIPPLYVMTPLGFTPNNLQCPEVGNCINHPHTIDLSAVLGAGTENAQLPAHSHIINAGDPGWWKIVVIGVKTQADWDKIAAGKDLATVRGLQQSDPTNVTADIPTNSFLFFDVLSHGNYQINGSELTNTSQ